MTSSFKVTDHASPRVRTYPKPVNVRLIPELAAVALKRKLHKEMAMWFILRAINSWGSGILELPPTMVCPNPQLSPSTPEVDPTQLLPQLLDQLTALGDLARQLSHALGGNGHRPEKAADLIQQLIDERR